MFVGVTGGIGSGKSVVCKIFECLNVPVYYADDRAKWLMRNDVDLIKGIIETFGQESYPEGVLNTRFLSKTVFSNKDQLDRLNALVHPAVAKDVNRWIDQNQDSFLLIKEAALLFETGSYKELDYVITVAAKEETRIRRVLARDPQRSREEIVQIMGKQMPQEEKMELADYVIDNNDDDALIRQVYNFLKEKGLRL